MTSARPVFGDFLDIAHRQLDRSSAGAQVRGGEDLGEACRNLRQLVVVLERHAGDLVVPRKMAPDAGRGQSAWDQVPASACRALNHAAAVLSQPQVRTNPGAAGTARSLAGDFDAVARSLTAGRDLLHTHRATTALGTSEDRTEWGPVIASPPVARARLAEMAVLAERIASRGRRAALASGWRGSPETRRRLTVACDWLMTFEAAVRAASDQEPVPAKDRELLRAIPADTLPLQRAPAGESAGELCAQISANAERARRAAWQSVPDAAWSPETTITSLRRVAEASAVTGRNCEIVLGSLADDAEPPLPDRIRDTLSRAAAAAGRARAGWLRAAHSLDNLTTDTSGSVSWSAREASEIALWTGRLANGDPDWVPSAIASRAPAKNRDPRTAGRGRNDIAAAVAAVHESCHALAGLARADYERIRRAAGTGRILSPARSHPSGTQAQHPFVPAPPERIAVVLAEYHDPSWPAARRRLPSAKSPRPCRLPVVSLPLRLRPGITASPLSELTGRSLPVSQEFSRSLRPPRRPARSCEYCKISRSPTRTYWSGPLYSTALASSWSSTPPSSRTDDRTRHAQPTTCLCT